MIARGLGACWSFVVFAARTCAAIPAALVLHAGEVVVQFEQVAVRSFPIVVGAGLSVGLVTWLQTHRLLVQHGAESTLPSFLAVAVLVEIGPILAGLLVASRMGAGLAAELGTMVLNEEIDARRALGVDPLPSLVAPRAIACMLAVPLLTVVLDASAMLGGLAAEQSAGNLTARTLLEQGDGLSPARRHHPGDAQDRRLRPAGRPGLVLDRPDRRALRRGRRPGRHPRRRALRPVRFRVQRRNGTVDPVFDGRRPLVGVGRGAEANPSCDPGDGAPSSKGATPMSRKIGRWRVAVSLGFALAVLALSGWGIHAVASRHWQVQPTFRVRAEFTAIGGLEAGHRVRVQGIDAGVVERVVPPDAAREAGRPGPPDRRTIAPLVRSDAIARIISEGLVGAKVVELTPGHPHAPPVAEMGRIASERPIEIADVLKRASGSLERLEDLTRSAESGLAEVNTIAGSIRRGEGSLGKLVKDDTIYNDMVALSRRGERALTGLEDNLDALKQTWPLSRYFDRRAYVRPRAGALPAGVAPEWPVVRRRGAVRAQPFGAHAGRPDPARRGRRLDQAVQPHRDAGGHRRLHR